MVRLLFSLLLLSAPTWAEHSVVEQPREPRPAPDTCPKSLEDLLASMSFDASDKVIHLDLVGKDDRKYRLKLSAALLGKREKIGEAIRALEAKTGERELKPAGRVHATPDVTVEALLPPPSPLATPVPKSDEEAAAENLEKSLGARHPAVAGLRDLVRAQRAGVSAAELATRRQAFELLWDDRLRKFPEWEKFKALPFKPIPPISLRPPEAKPALPRDPRLDY